jgi:hypothetical protein
MEKFQKAKFMKKLMMLWFCLVLFLHISAQENPNAKKIYETERAFEKAVAEKGIKQGFLEFLTDEGMLYNPLPVNGKQYWLGQPDSPASLTWNPVFVDASSNGALAYTTGNGIYRPKGKDDPAAFYSEYVTVWQRQPGGNYKFIIDIGITHDKPAAIETGWKSAPVSNENPAAQKTTSTAAAQLFFETAMNEGIPKAYKNFAADDIRLLREGMTPITGKKAALDQTKKEKDQIKFAKRMFFVSAGDLAYLSDTYVMSNNGKMTGRGNLVQIWKLKGGVWQIVMDITTPIPLAQN